jgi:glycosyltransferase involved in cell wall biosynthesis
MVNNSESLVSVIIPTFNSGQYIKAALESVFNQTYKNIEVIVVDDGSTDNTRVVLEAFMKQIKYIYKENGGPASARNRGVKEAKGEFIAFLDADDMWLPEKIELQFGVFVKDQRIGLVSCNHHQIDEKGQILEESKHIHYLSQKVLFNVLLVKNVVSGGSNAIIKKECFDKVGLFDEHLHGTEDWDMWLRIAKYYDVKFVEQPLVKIMVRQNSISGTTNADKMLENELRVLDKLFNSKDIKFNWYLKNRSYCYRYFCAAWAFWDARERSKAKKYILKSLFTNPFYFITNKDCLALLAKIFLINRKGILK